jgi:glutamate dehydrogenase (NADP+)
MDSKKPRASPSLELLLEKVALKDGHKPEFVQCVKEISASLEPVFLKDPEMIDLFERLVEPERVLQFRVVWVDDKGAQVSLILITF